MKKSLLVAALSVVALGGYAWSHSGHDAEHGAGGKEVTVKGELLDMFCYMPHEGKGKKHVECARMCIKNGAPLGILTQDGKVYLLIEDHSSAKARKPYEQAREMVGDTMTVKGDAYERGGVQAIAVESVVME
ncbi:MAG: hypothetical protein HKL90_01550 [Elusimicrobia bacterium]|nr:hypothetical protein [Elusimicrobiota bacterium]